MRVKCVFLVIIIFVPSDMNCRYSRRAAIFFIEMIDLSRTRVRSTRLNKSLARIYVDRRASWIKSRDDQLVSCCVEKPSESGHRSGLDSC